MRYLFLTEDGLLEGSDIAPADLVKVAAGDLTIIRQSVDRFEYAEVTSRSVDAKTNSLDEVRYDQAIDGQIYEVASWHPLQVYDRDGPPRPAPGEGSVTVIDDERVRESIRADVRADEAIRREGITEELREEEQRKLDEGK